MSLKYTEKKQGRYKRNSIKVDLHRAKKISTNFKEEIKFIRNKFVNADFPLPFINSVIRERFQQSTENRTTKQ